MKTVLMIHRCNPNRGNGGVEKYIRNQITALQEKNVTTILLFPVRKNHIIHFNYLGLLINKEFKGVFHQDSVFKWLEQLQETSMLSTIIIHHLSNFDIPAIKKIFNTLKFKKILFYIHDYYTACPQYNLLKNDKEYCGDAMITDQKCSSCSYCHGAMQHHTDMLYLFQQANKQHLEIIAPSEFCSDLWGNAFPAYKDNIRVVPHLKLKGIYTDNKNQIDPAFPVKVGFVGNQSQNKGWDKWILASEQIHQAHLPVELYYIGSGKDQRPFVKNIEASIEKNGNDAMINALRNCKLDCAILFSNCPETYSYTYFEAFASNCFIVTNADSGNIAFQVKNNRNGIVLYNSAQALFDFFKNADKFYETINCFKKGNVYGPQILEENFYDLDLMDSNEAECEFIKPHKNISIRRFLVEHAYRFKYRRFI